MCDLETSKEVAESPLKGCEYKPTMGCDAERKTNGTKHNDSLIDEIRKSFLYLKQSFSVFPVVKIT